jgi:cell division protein FtsL
MKPCEFDLKTTDELERRLAQQEFDDLGSGTEKVVVQLLVVSFLIVATTILLTKVFT